MLMLRKIARASLAFGLLLVWISQFATAQTVGAPTDVKAPPEESTAPVRLSESALALADAVRLTLLYSPAIQAAKQDVAAARARLQEASGVFDAVVSASPSVSYEKNEMGPSIRQREIDKREQLRIVAETFESLSAQLKKTIDEMSIKPPFCPDGFEFDNGIILDGLDESESTQIGLSSSSSFVNLDIEGGVADFNTVCIQPTDFTFPDITLEFLQEINRIQNLGLQDFITDFTQFPEEELNLAYEISEAVAVRSRLGLERLGGLPIDEITKSVAFSFGYLRSFRNGMGLSVDANFSSSQHNFKDKNLDPTFGGFGQQDRFPSFIQALLNVPLRKGRGRISAAAPERAAELNLDASEDSLRHRMSEEVFRAVLAYLDLVAAQSTQELLQESADRQDRFVDITEQLIAADELPRMELGRARARAAQVKSSLLDARVATLSSRLDLAQAIGIEVSDLSEAPIALDRFLEDTEQLPELERLVTMARTLRRDARALDSMREASLTLAEAARWDSRYLIDLSVNAGLNSLYESPFFKFLPDELELDELPEFQPTQYFNPGGYWRNIRGNWTPFFKIGITFEVPFANNRAKGRLVQAEASRRSSEVKQRDIHRVIQDNVIQVAGALERAAQAIDRRQEAISNYEQTLDASQQLFALGDLSLVDTLITEEDLTREKLQLVNALKTYYATLTRLQFEIGDLVHFDNEGLPFEMVEFDSRGLVAAR